MNAHRVVALAAACLLPLHVDAAGKSTEACARVKDRLAEAYFQAYGQRHYTARPGPCPPMAAGGRRGGPGATPPRAPALHFTGTNNQVAGVDESDTLKTDGQHLYTLRGREVVVTRVHPPKEAGVVARLPVDSTPQRLLLAGSRLVVIGQGTQVMTLTLYDVGDPSAPKLERHLELDALPVSERLIGETLVLVTSASLRIPEALIAESLGPLNAGTVTVPCCGGASQLTAAREKIVPPARRALRKYDANDAMPRLRIGKKERPLLSCDAVEDAGAPAGAMLGLVTRIDLSDMSIRTAAVTGAPTTVYASAESVYLSWTRIDPGSRRCGGAAVSPFERFPGTSHTTVAKFQLGATPSFAGVHRTTGALLNQFALDEHRGRLRLALNGSGASTIEVVEERGGSLKPVGRLSGLAPGEDIYAVRFMGDSGYLVTFPRPQPIRIDPFFTLDLAEPAAPKVSGELKIPGFSNYLHPYGEGRLLAVGQDADEEGRPRGMHLQIFDVSNPAKPQRIHHHRVEKGPWSTSLAQVDHHAFLSDPVTGIVAVPVVTNGWAGALVFRAKKKKLVQLGTLSHPGAAITRMFVAGDHLYAVSDAAVTAHALDDLAPVAQAAFAPR